MADRDGLLVVSRGAVDDIVAAALSLERQARTASPALRQALADFMTSARPVGPERPWLSMQEAADALGLSVRTVRRRVKSGELAHRREGRRVLIPARWVRD